MLLSSKGNHCQSEEAGNWMGKIDASYPPNKDLRFKTKSKELLKNSGKLLQSINEQMY